jgi:hypothetical protein
MMHLSRLSSTAARVSAEPFTGTQRYAQRGAMIRRGVIQRTGTMSPHLTE